MRIALKTSFLDGKNGSGFGNYATALFFNLAKQQSHHQFFVIANTNYVGELLLPPNVQVVVLKLKEDGIFLRRRLVDLKVAKALRRIKVDFFISADGLSNVITQIPQLMWTNVLPVNKSRGERTKLQQLFYQLHFTKCIKKAKVIATPSVFLNTEIEKRYTVSSEKLFVIKPAIMNGFVPMDWEEKEKVKELFSEGCEFFVFVGGFQPQKNLLNVLKAFSLFKKRQQTNMKLLIVGNLNYNNKDNLDKIESYKFRKGIKLLGYLSPGDYKQIMGAAYGLIYPVLSDDLGLPVLEAMAAGVAVLTSDIKHMEAIGGDAALYADATEPGLIADQMKLLYKDENTRSKLIERGKILAQQFSDDQSSLTVWSIIQQTVSQ